MPRSSTVTGDIGHIGVGAACHPARATALLRAVLEAAQVRTTYIIGSREDIEPGDYDPATLARRNAEARALMRPTERSRDFQVGRKRGVGDLRGRGRLASRQASIDRAETSHRRRSDTAGVWHTCGANGRSRPRRLGSSVVRNIGPDRGRAPREDATLVTSMIFVGPTLDSEEIWPGRASSRPCRRSPRATFIAPRATPTRDRHHRRLFLGRPFGLAQGNLVGDVRGRSRVRKR